MTAKLVALHRTVYREPASKCDGDKECLRLALANHDAPANMVIEFSFKPPDCHRTGLMRHGHASNTLHGEAHAKAAHQSKLICVGDYGEEHDGRERHK